MKFTFKSLLVVCTMLLGNVNAWSAGYTRTLTSELEVAGYKAKTLYDFQNNNPEVLPTTGDLRYRGYESGGYWGLHNYGSGGRSATVDIPVSTGELVVMQCYSSDNEVTISHATLDEVLTTSTGYRCFNVTEDASDLTITAPRYAGVVALLVMEVDNDVTVADYTINYKLNGDIVMTETGSAAVGTEIFVKTSFFENEVKYLLNEGEQTSLIISEKDNILDINVSIAPMYSYIVNAKADDKVLKELANGSIYVGEKVSVPFPRYFNVEGTLYSKAANNNEYTQSVTVTEDNMIVDFVYTATDKTNVVYYSEGEDIDGATVNTTATNVAIRASNAAVGDGENVKVCTLPAGVYKFTIGQHMHRSNYTGTVTLDFGEQQFGYTATNVNLSEKTSDDEYVIDDNTDVTFTTLDYGHLDYVYIQKVRDLKTEELTSTSTLQGYKTYYNAETSYKVDENTTVYSTAYNEANNTVTLTSLDTKVIPAGTPVIVKTSSSDYTITLTETAAGSADAIDGNELEAAEAAGVQANAYILARTNEKELAFYLYEGSLAVGDVYLPIANGQGIKSIAIAVDGTATAIETVEAENEADGALYNVAGQQVGSDYKGIVIKNGKKYLNK